MNGEGDSASGADQLDCQDELGSTSGTTGPQNSTSGSESQPVCDSKRDGLSLFLVGTATDPTFSNGGIRHRQPVLGQSPPGAESIDRQSPCDNCHLSGSDNDSDSNDSTVGCSNDSKPSVVWPASDFSPVSASPLSVHEGSDSTSSDDSRTSVTSSLALGPSEEGTGTVRSLRYRGLPSSVPVRGESYCDCPLTTQATSYSTRRLQNVESADRYLECACGEDEHCLDWTWDHDSKSSATEITSDGKRTFFHLNYSSGTAAVRGDKLLSDDQHYWEIKMISPVYGTDMMVGVGNKRVYLNAVKNHFCSFLGRNADSWGFSYMGHLYHKGWYKSYGARFGQGTILGVHLDMWHGTLSFYKNRKPLGVAFRGLQGKELYPMVSSTAAQSGMKLTRACSFRTSLQFFCCQVLRQMIPDHLNVLDEFPLPPGLNDYLTQELFWLLGPRVSQRKTDTTSVTLEKSEPEIKRKSRRLYKRSVMIDAEMSDLETCIPSTSSSHTTSGTVNGSENLSGRFSSYSLPQKPCSSTSLSLPISLPQTPILSSGAEASPSPQGNSVVVSLTPDSTRVTSADSSDRRAQPAYSTTVGHKSPGTVDDELTHIRNMLERSRNSTQLEAVETTDNAPETCL